MRPLRYRLPIVLASLFACSGCGFGSAGIVAGASGGSSGNSAPSLSLDVQGFTIELPKEPPAKIKLTLSDPESDPAKVELFYVMPSEPTTIAPMSAVGPNPMTLATSPDGVEHEISWDFTNEARLPADGSYVDGVKVIARVEGGASRELVFGLGNDAPVVDSIEQPPGEAVGVAPIRFAVSDSSNDDVDVGVEYQVLGETEWRRARPAGLVSGSATPEFAFEGAQANASGSTHVFFWDTDHSSQLRDLERGVRVRFTPRDAVAIGESRETGPLVVDNNDEPAVQIDDSFIVNPDARRGIPIPFRIFDDESDEVRVLFQWRRASEPFPDLGTTDVAELASRMQDHGWVLAKQICRQRPHFASGRIVAIDDLHMRLPELAAEQSWILGQDLLGLELQLPRPRTAHRLSEAWGSKPLTRPVAALPVGDGTRAIVLDESSSGWELLELGLTTGAIERIVASGQGAPRALSFESGRDTAVIAAQSGSNWSLVRVDFASAVTTALATVDAGVAEPIRGVAPVGTHVALVTAADAVWRVDWFDSSAPGVHRVAEGLAAPHGVIPDPLHPDRSVLVAERDADRVVRVDAYTHVVERVVDAPTLFPKPTSIAHDRTQNRLLVVCEPAAGTATNDLRAFVLGRQIADSFHVVAELDPGSTSVAVGESHLILATHASTAECIAIGGIEQARTVTGFDVATKVVALDTALDLPARDADRWRIRAREPFSEPFRATRGGRLASFVWDADDVRGGGDVHVRALCFDTEPGRGDETSSPRSVGHALDREESELPGFEETPVRAIVDVDGDGDLDLVGGGTDELLVHLQTGPRTFEHSSWRIPLAGVVPLTELTSVDMDRDGDIDLVTSHGVAFQTAPGAFVTVTIDGGTALGQLSVQDADLDGLSDILEVRSSSLLYLHRQVSAGVFAAPEPLELTIPSPLFTAELRDLDLDGNPDLVAASPPVGALVWFGVPTLPFADDPMVVPGPGTPSLGTATADLDQDGRLDLVVTSLRNAQGILAYLQTESRAFSAGIEVGEWPVVNIQLYFTVPADLDGDGAIDLVVSTDVDGTRAQFQQRAATFRQSPRQWAGFRGIPPTRAVDLDGDGAIDLVGGLEGTRIAFGDNGGAFEFGEALNPSGDIPFFGALADLDGDGLTDIVTLNSQPTGDASLTAFRHRVPGTFDSTPSRIPDLSEVWGPVKAIDIDGDGHVDVAHRGSETIERPMLAIRYGSGSADVAAVEVAAWTASADFENPNDFEVVDIDRDGDFDIVLMSSLSGVTLLRQLTPRDFAPPEQIIAVEPSAWIVAADFDGDGDQDLAFQDHTYLAVALQAPDGTFVISRLGELVDQPSREIPSPIVADIDGDGDLDILASAWDDTLVLFGQIEPGTWRWLSSIACPSRLFLRWSVLDVDGDGDLDLHCDRALLQAPDGAFEESAVIDLPWSFLEPFDIDGDGDVDVVTRGLDGLELHMGGR